MEPALPTVAARVVGHTRDHSSEESRLTGRHIGDTRRAGCARILRKPFTPRPRRPLRNGTPSPVHPRVRRQHAGGPARPGSRSIVARGARQVLSLAGSPSARGGRVAPPHAETFQHFRRAAEAPPDSPPHRAPHPTVSCGTARSATERPRRSRDRRSSTPDGRSPLHAPAVHLDGSSSSTTGDIGMRKSTRHLPEPAPGSAPWQRRYG